MEFEGTVYKVLPVVKGTSQRGEWMKQEVVFELPGEFNRKICVASGATRPMMPVRFVKAIRWRCPSMSNRGSTTAVGSPKRADGR